MVWEDKEEGAAAKATPSTVLHRQAFWEMFVDSQLPEARPATPSRGDTTAEAVWERKPFRNAISPHPEPPRNMPSKYHGAAGPHFHPDDCP